VALATASRPGAPAPDVLEVPGDTPPEREQARALTERLAVEAPATSVAIRLTPAGIQTADAVSIAPIVHWVANDSAPPADLLTSVVDHKRALFLETSATSGPLDPAVDRLVSWAHVARAAGVDAPILALTTDAASVTIRAYRLLAARLARDGLACPLHLVAPAEANPYERLLRGSVALGSLLCDGIGDSVEVRGGEDPAAIRLAFNILQASGARISKTEYVACPSCGRTLFDLQPVTDRIKTVTGHLTGVKIAIMGCIVNGPGEMADADFGYVGGAPGKVNLYVGKECVEKNVPQDEADERLIALIKSHGRWTEE